MKRIVIFITVFLLVFNIAAWVSAAPQTKNCEVSLSATPAEVKVGETVTLTATTEKHGSSFKDEWKGAAGKPTVFVTETGNYISTAEFNAEKPGIYTICYEITMKAGNSDVTFCGTKEMTIKVINPAPVTVVGAGIKNLVFTSVSNGYQADFTYYAIWSDGSTTSDTTMRTGFGLNQTSKNVTVPVYVDGKYYNSYTVTVTRE